LVSGCASSKFSGPLIALHGFIKKAQKTAPEDLALARQRLKELLSS